MLQTSSKSFQLEKTFSLSFGLFDPNPIHSLFPSFLANLGNWVSLSFSLFTFLWEPPSLWSPSEFISSLSFFHPFQKERSNIFMGTSFLPLFLFSPSWDFTNISVLFFCYCMRQKSWEKNMRKRLFLIFNLGNKLSWEQKWKRGNKWSFFFFLLSWQQV